MRKRSEGNLIIDYIRKFTTVYAPAHKSGSPNTLKSYKITIKLYLDFLQFEKGVIPSTLNGDCFNKKHLEEWIIWLREDRKCGLATCKTRLSMLRTFLKYLYDKDPAFLSLYVHAKNVKVETPPKVKVRGISREAVKTLITLPDLDTRAGRRDLTLMEIMYVTACRLDEVLSMKISNLHLKGPKPYIIISGKGSKTRTIYVHAHAAATVMKYIKAYHGENPNPDSFVFYSVVGGFQVKLSQAAVDKRLKMYAQKGHALCADIPLGLHSHQFRHARASHWLEDGMNIVQISFLLGHESVETTMRYLDVSTEQLRLVLSEIEGEKDTANCKKTWKNGKHSLAGICGVD